MVSQNSISYADRAKSGGPRSTPASALKASQPIAAPASASSAISPSDVAVVSSNKEVPPTRAIAEPIPNGVELASSGSTNDQHHQPAAQISLPPASTTIVNGFHPAANSSSSNHLTSSVPTTKQPNVWAARNQQRNTARPTPQAPTTTHPQPSFQPPNTQHPQSSSASASSQSQSEMKSQASRSSDSAHVGVAAPLASQQPTVSQPVPQSSKLSKKKPQNSKASSTSSTPAPSSSTTAPPPFSETSSWPAPNEAAAAPINGIASAVRKDGQGTEEEVKQGPSHSRESSSTGTGGHAGHSKKRECYVSRPPSGTRVKFQFGLTPALDL